MFGVLSNLLYLPVVGAGFGFGESNLSGRVIVFVLLVGSVCAWTMMVNKWIELKRAANKSEDFMLAYRGESHPVALFLRGDDVGSGSPLSVIYDQSCSALVASLEASSGNIDELFNEDGGELLTLTERHINTARNSTDRNVADLALLLENNMGLLATAASTAPFLGLLGTVWGVMEAFGNMGSSGAALLSDVAPGISGALLTTVVGLLVALPSSIGYNLLSDRIRRLTVLMDNFAQELVGDLERVHLP